MALVVLLRGVNVGGHRTFRPKQLAGELKHLDAVNIGAAGTFVVRKRIARAALRAELARRLPFETEIVICSGRELADLATRHPFALLPDQPGVVRFVSVLSARPRLEPALPLSLPADGSWLMRLVAREGRFVLGLYRRHLKVVGLLGTIDRHFGVPVTTRNWNTVTQIVRALGAGGTQ